MKSFKPEEIIRALTIILNIDQKISGLNYLKLIVKNIAKTFEARYVFVGHAVRPGNDSVQTDVVWAGDDYAENFTYLLKGTPCENVYTGNRVCFHPGNVAEEFPEDTLLAEMGVESYIGAPLLTEDGELSGILVILDDKPIRDVDFYSAAIDFLSMRLGTELYRHYSEERLKRLVAERTMELEESNQKLQNALSEIKTLQGIIPICSKCKKIRDDQGFWQQVESYVTKHSQATFSHAICPECLEEYYRELQSIK
jgi:hypothetical protein